MDFLSSNLLTNNTNIIHGFFARAHGIAKNDESERSLVFGHIAKLFGVSKEKLLTLSQIHSSKVLVVDAPFVGEAPKADALITREPGLLLGVLTSDCVPILLASLDTQMVAAIHAGWKGALGGIVQATVNKMMALGAKNIIAALGPCIWQQSYEVSYEFYENFGPSKEFFIKSSREGHWLFDLPGFVIHCLKESGIKNIEPSMANTYANKEHFYSFRRKTHNAFEEYKNQISVIGIKSHEFLLRTS